EIKVRLFDATAVATSRIKNPNYPTNGRLTNVYVKRQGRWQCVASHACGISSTTCPALNGPLGVRLTQPAGQKMDCTACHNQPHTANMQPRERGDLRIGKLKHAG